MQEFPFDIVEALRRGLVRDSEVQPINEVGLVTLKNLRSDENGLREFKAITAPLTTTAFNDWPFPQYFVTEDRKILAGATSLFYLTDGGTSSVLTIRDATAPASTTSIKKGGPWHQASFARTWFLTNGSTLVWQVPSSTTGVTEWTVASSDTPVNTVCSFRNHLFVGGLATTAAWFSSSLWSELWEAWRANSPDDEFVYENVALDRGWILWSEEIGGDLNWPFVLQVALLGYPTAPRSESLAEFLLEELRTGGIGFSRLPYRGEVLGCLPLGQANLIVYGEHGIGVVSPVEGEKKFSLGRLKKVGLASRSSFGGDEEDHLFIDKTGYLWELNRNLTFTRHDYRHLISTLTAATLVVVRDPTRLEWYISDGTKGYLFNGTSMSETTVFPSSLEIDGTALTGVTKDLSDANFNVKTTWIDFGLAGLKTIHNVQVAAQDLKLGSISVRVEFRYKGQDSYSTHGPILLNAEGIAHMYLTALQFRIRLSGPLGSTTKIDYIRVRYQVPDKRAIRGIFGREQTR